MKANYYLEKQISYYVAEYVEKSQSGHKRFQTFAQKQSIFQYYFFQLVVLSTLDRLKRDVYSLCIGSALLSQNYKSHVTSTLYKPDISLRRTVELGPDGVRLTESSLYHKSANLVFTTDIYFNGLCRFLFG